jgi:phage I-like protein
MTELSLSDAAGTLPEWIRLLPLGEVKLSDDREPFTVDQASLSNIVQQFTARGIDLVIDYEHQSLGGERAPAAGWIKELQARLDGLWGRVNWTAQASEYLKNKEYRYFSPVLRMDPATRKPTSLMHVGLTNVPAINHLTPLVAAKYGEASGNIIVFNSPAETPAPQQQEEATAMLKKLVLKLGLKPETTEDEVLNLVADQAQEAVALKLQTAVLPEIALAVGLEQTSTPAQIKGAVLALKQGAGHLAAIQAEVEALKTESTRVKAASAVDEALKAGKLTPAQQEWALEYAGRDLEGFKVFVEKSPQIVPVGKAFRISGETGAGPDRLTPDELAVCQQLNLTPEAFKIQRQAMQEG